MGMKIKIHSRIIRQESAFSLVEVVLAIGLVSFCLLALVGLLPVALRSIKNAHEESAAANALSQLADALRNATTNAGGKYVAAGGFSSITWSSSPGGATSTNLNLALNGQPTNVDARLVARVEILSPATSTAPFLARVSVAWPRTATWSNSAWTKSEGSINSGLQFLSVQ